MDYDEFLNTIGGFGRYQRRFFGVVAFPAVIFGACGAFGMIYLAATPKYGCNYPPELVQSYRYSIGNQTNRTMEADLSPMSNFLGMDVPSKCLMYDYSLFNWTYTADVPNDTVTCEPKFDKTDWDENIVTDFNLVCDRTHIVSTIYTVSSLGGTVGSLGTAFIQDNLGRRITFFIGVALSTIFGSCYMLSRNWETLATLVFLKGLVSSTYFSQPWILTVEMVSERYHGMSMFLICLGYAIGVGVLTVVSYLCRTWRQVILIVNVPGVVFLALFRIIDESPRWLLSKEGKAKKAPAVLEKMARMNGIKDGEIDCNTIHIRGHKSGETYGPGVCFRTKGLALKTIILSWIWTVCFMIYGGLSINTENLGGNLYVTFMLITLVEIPAAAMAKASDWTGRVMMTVISLLLGGISSLASGFVAPDDVTTNVLLTTLTKFTTTISFNTVILVMGELYPTCIRGTGLSVCSIMPSILSVGTPYIVFTAKVYGNWLPMTIFGVLLISAAIVCAFLPETLGKPLPDILEHEKLSPVGMSAFINNITFRSVVQAWKGKKEKPSNKERDESKEVAKELLT